MCIEIRKVEIRIDNWSDNFLDTDNWIGCYLNIIGRIN